MASASKLEKTNEEQNGECVDENGDDVYEEIAGTIPNTNDVIVKRVTIHKEKSFAKNNAKPSPTSGCYKLMGVKWATSSLPVSYAVNPTNSMGLDITDIISNISITSETWDNATPRELFNNYVSTTSASYGSLDSQNTIVFGNNAGTGVIAVTSTWYIRSTRQIVEFDMSLETDYTWSLSGEAGKMDVQNIVTHELGHGIGLADLYNSCTQETMYGYSTFGEISKRSLNSGDKAGLLSLYR